MVDLGKKIRELRLANDLTQEELANRVELTKGYISQLENNLTSPSINTLYSILEVLGTDVHEFFSLENDVVITYKEEDYYSKEDNVLKNEIFWIVPNAQKYQMEPIIVEIESGGQTAIDEPHSGEEFGYVLEGRITLVYNKKRYPLKRGETFYYLAHKEHYIINNSSSKAKVLWVSTPPMI
jgi:transcriptional regulator with XRE-family HTH domain